MLLNVDDPRLNLILNGCFWALVLITLLSMFPWGWLGLGRRMAHTLPGAALGVYIVYEWAMPSRMDIRIDLLFLAPMGAIILTAWGIRLIFRPKGDRTSPPPPSRG